MFESGEAVEAQIALLRYYIEGEIRRSPAHVNGYQLTCC